MKLGTMAAVAAAMMLSAVTPADAGDKKSKSKNVHIDSGVSSKNLRAVSKQLKGHQKKAVMDEIERRERKHSNKKFDKYAGEWIGRSTDIEAQIIGLGLASDLINKRNRKGGH